MKKIIAVLVLTSLLLSSIPSAANAIECNPLYPIGDGRWMETKHMKTLIKLAKKGWEPFKEKWDEVAECYLDSGNQFNAGIELMKTWHADNDRHVAIDISFEGQNLARDIYYMINYGHELQKIIQKQNKEAKRKISRILLILNIYPHETNFYRYSRMNYGQIEIYIMYNPNQKSPTWLDEKIRAEIARVDEVKER